jgi:WD40 repeat protein
MDPTRRWLAALTDQEMAVWDMQRLLFARQLSLSVSDGTDIAFDQEGKLLALGTKRGITIYDVEQAKQVAEFNVGEVTAIYFTRDNRLLVWGDSEGNLHLWGVPQK